MLCAAWLDLPVCIPVCKLTPTVPTKLHYNCSFNFTPCLANYCCRVISEIYKTPVQLPCGAVLLEEAVEVVSSEDESAAERN